MGTQPEITSAAEQKQHKSSSAKAVGPDIKGNNEIFQLSKSLQTALFGGVYEARGLSSGGHYAVKVLHKSELKRATKHANSSDFCEIPLSELRFQSQMTGLPHVAEVVDSFEDEWCHYIVFPLAEGGDLLEALKKKSFGFNEANAIYLIRQAAQGLASLHERNLAMQDVSLENMLVFSSHGPGGPPTSTSTIKICDPGQATLFERDSNDEELPVRWRGMVGKSFRPPELQQNKPYISTLVDAWCLGWSTFYLLVAQPLFMSAENTDTGWRQFAKGDFATLCDRKTSGSSRAQLSDRALDFIKRLMEIEPSRRMSVHEALRHPWLMEQGLAPSLTRGEMHLLDPPRRPQYSENIRIVQESQARGRSPSPKSHTATPALNFRGTSPIQIPNFRMRWKPVPRQGSPMGIFTPNMRDQKGEIIRPSITARSLSPPPQIMIRPDTLAAPQYAWTPISHSPSPGPSGNRMRTPRKQRVPLPISLNNQKKEITSTEANSTTTASGNTCPSWAWTERLVNKRGTSPILHSSRRNSGMQRSLSPFTLNAQLTPNLLKPNIQGPSRFAWDPNGGVPKVEVASSSTTRGIHDPINPSTRISAELNRKKSNQGLVPGSPLSGMRNVASSISTNGLVSPQMTSSQIPIAPNPSYTQMRAISPMPPSPHSPHLSSRIDPFMSWSMMAPQTTEDGEQEKLRDRLLRAPYSVTPNIPMDKGWPRARSPEFLGGPLGAGPVSNRGLSPQPIIRSSNSFVIRGLSPKPTNRNKKDFVFDKRPTNRMKWMPQ